MGVPVVWAVSVVADPGQIIDEPEMVGVGALEAVMVSAGAAPVHPAALVTVTP